MNPLAWTLDRLVTRATVTTADGGDGTVQMRGLSGGGISEILPSVSQWALPYFYSVARAGVRGIVLRLLRGGGIMVGAKHSRPSDSVAGDAGVFNGTALVRLLWSNYFEVKGTQATGGISLGARDFSEGVPLYVVRTTDPVAADGVYMGACQATTTKTVSV